MSAARPISMCRLRIRMTVSGLSRVRCLMELTAPQTPTLRSGRDFSGGTRWGCSCSQLHPEPDDRLGRGADEGQKDFGPENTLAAFKRSPIVVHPFIVQNGFDGLDCRRIDGSK